MAVEAPGDRYWRKLDEADQRSHELQLVEAQRPVAQRDSAGDFALGFLCGVVAMGGSVVMGGRVGGVVVNPRAMRAHNPDPDPLDDPRHDRPTDVEVDYFREMGFGDWEDDYARFIVRLETAA